MENLEPTKIAYSAGIIDGEGSIYTNRTKNNQCGECITVVLMVQMTRQEPLIILSQLFGSEIVLREGKHKPIYRWQVRGNNAIQTIKTVLPYLTVKTEQAKLALQFNIQNTNCKLTREERLNRDKLSRRIKSLNV